MEVFILRSISSFVRYFLFLLLAFGPFLLSIDSPENPARIHPFTPPAGPIYFARRPPATDPPGRSGNVGAPTQNSLLFLSFG
jgi:hypothetical protein